MQNYNAPFFGLYENWYLILYQKFGEEKSLALFREVMEKGLKAAYGIDFNKGEPHEFVRLVGTRDHNVGLNVKFPIISENKIIYQFHTDPFPNLKNVVSHEKLDHTFIFFKIRYLLGENWQYKNTYHFWKGDGLTEFIIWK
jgi:hypothetical protein